MTKRPATSRADLLTLLLRASGGLDERAAEVLGFERRPQESAPKSAMSPPDELESLSGASWEEEPPVEPVITFPTERPRLQFLMALTAETLLEEPPAKAGHPISDAELAVNWSQPGPLLAPLTRWARLAPFLRHRLGTVLPGARLDLRRLMRLAGRGQPVLALPRLHRGAWAAQAVVLWDVTPEMSPWLRDAQALLRRLRRERGRHGLAVREIRGLPSRELLALLPVGAPVLAISAMGRLVQGAEIGAAWVALARRLALRGQPIAALNPCPRSRWNAGLAAAWPSAAWDRHPRLPRHGGLRPVAPVPEAHAINAAKLLLDLLAPASRIEPPLLRAARLRLGRGADTGTEWDAWHHADCWQSADCFGFRPGPAYEARLERRQHELSGGEARLAAEIGALMPRHHATCSAVIAAEAELRVCLSGGPPDAAALEQVRVLLERVVDRLRLLGADPGSAEGGRSGLSAWFVGMVDRLSPTMRGEPMVRELIAQGLAEAHAFLETAHAVVPAGVDGGEFVAEGRRVRAQLPPPVDYRVVQRDSQLFVVPSQDQPAVAEMPLAVLRVGRRVVHLSQVADHFVQDRYQLASPPSALPMASLSEPIKLIVETDRQRLHLAPVERPAWAERLWHDRFGLAAEFRVGGVPFVLRWIPPGRFFMGSPEDEPGRWEAEGPRHEVTISAGFWLGETPVTQAQWRAVVAEAAKDQAEFARLTRKTPLKPEPSHFQGSGELPVESVNWYESGVYCQFLNHVLENRLTPTFQFRLPTEAQWEYACRAGTETALYTGGITIRGEHHAPELDAIAWYGGNSGQELEVKNPSNSKPWPGKQYEDEKAGTHRVKLKEPNGWGLHDMLGNVWEWCSDEWNAGAYQHRKDGTVASAERAVDESARRVIRGGAWDDPARGCRAAFRSHFGPGYRWRHRGFRLSAGQELGAAEPLGAERPSGPARRSRG